MKEMECLKEIEDLIVNKYGFEFPKVEKKLSTKKEIDYNKVVKRILGIIKNYDESNAELKVKSVIAYLASVKRFF